MLLCEMHRRRQKKGKINRQNQRQREKKSFSLNASVVVSLKYSNGNDFNLLQCRFTICTLNPHDRDLSDVKIVIDGEST